MTSKLFSRGCLTVDDFDLTDQDKLKLKNEITVPLPINEKKRLKFLREAKIFDTDENEEPYDRYTTLAARIFDVMFSVVTNCCETHVNNCNALSSLGAHLYRLSN